MDIKEPLIKIKDVLNGKYYFSEDKHLVRKSYVDMEIKGELLYEYTNCSVYRLNDNDVVIMLTDDECGPHCPGDKWTVWFHEHQSFIEVLRIEKISPIYSNILLHFGNQLSDDEIEQIKTGKVYFSICRD